MNLAMIMSSVKNVTKWVIDPNNRTIILFIAIVIGCAFMFQQRNKIKALEMEQNRYQSNVVALTDSLQSYRSSNGDLVSQKGALQTSVEELKTMNLDLYEELEKEKGKPPKTITKIETVVKWDTVYTNLNEYTYLGGESHQITWGYQESGEWGLRSLEGKSRFDFVNDSLLTNINTQITRDEFRISITTGFREREDGTLQAYARTSAPSISFTQVDGAIIDPKNYVEQKPTRWGIGFQVGYGVNTDLTPSYHVGLGLSYNFITW